MSGRSTRESALFVSRVVIGLQFDRTLGVGQRLGPGGAGYVRACYTTSHAEIEEALERIQRRDLGDTAGALEDIQTAQAHPTTIVATRRRLARSRRPDATRSY